MTPEFERILASAERYLDTRNNLVHTRIVASYAERLAEIEGGDIRIILPAAILHDVGWSNIPEELHLTAFGPRATNRELNRAHEIGGVTIARQILEALGYDADLTGHILRIIDGHDSHPEAISHEDAVVKDADKLWRYSKTGFKIDCTRFKLSPHESISRLQAKLPVWFLTESGTNFARSELAARKNELPIV